MANLGAAVCGTVRYVGGWSLCCRGILRAAERRFFYFFIFTNLCFLVPVLVPLRLLSLLLSWPLVFGCKACVASHTIVILMAGACTSRNREESASIVYFVGRLMPWFNIHT